MCCVTVNKWLSLSGSQYPWLWKQRWEELGEGMQQYKDPTVYHLPSMAVLLSLSDPLHPVLNHTALPVLLSLCKWPGFLLHKEEKSLMGTVSPSHLPHALPAPHGHGESILSHQCSIKPAPAGEGIAQ